MTRIKQTFCLLLIMLSCTSAAQAQLENIFSEFQPIKKNSSLSDYGQIHKSAKSYFEITPSTLAAAAKAVALAAEHNIPLRIRGAGHSMNGTSLPQQGELLLKTTKLRNYSFQQKGTISVGAGAKLWDIEQALRQKGFRLPIINGGGPAPTLGGFIAAGGFADGVEKHGGFWETVEEIKLVDGNGTLRTIKHDDPLFKWIPGSLGQLGVIVEAKLQILSTGSQQYPLNESGTLAQAAELDSYNTEHLLPEGKAFPVIYWFGFLAANGKAAAAQSDLKRLCDSYSEKIHFRLVAKRLINKHSISPPLIYPDDEDYTVYEAHGLVFPRIENKRLQIESFERELNQLALKKGYRRYIQVEFLPENFDYKEYYGSKIYQEFMNIKLRLDPKFIFARETVFPYPLKP